MVLNHRFSIRRQSSFKFNANPKKMISLQSAGRFFQRLLLTGGWQRAGILLDWLI
jgi:hypothetical protein